MAPWCKGVFFVFWVICNLCLNHDQCGELRSIHQTWPVGCSSSRTVGKAQWSLPPVLEMKPAQKSSPGASLSYQGVSDPPEWVDPPKGLITGESKSCYNGLIRFPQGGNYQCPQTSLGATQLALGWGSGVSWGKMGSLVLKRKHKAGFGEDPRVLSEEPHCPLSRLLAPTIWVSLCRGSSHGTMKECDAPWLL